MRSKLKKKEEPLPKEPLLEEEKVQRLERVALQLGVQPKKPEKPPPAPLPPQEKPEVRKRVMEMLKETEERASMEHLRQNIEGVIKRKEVEKTAEKIARPKVEKARVKVESPEGNLVVERTQKEEVHVKSATVEEVTAGKKPVEVIKEKLQVEKIAGVKRVAKLEEKREEAPILSEKAVKKLVLKRTAEVFLKPKKKEKEKSLVARLILKLKLFAKKLKGKLFSMLRRLLAGIKKLLRL